MIKATAQTKTHGWSTLRVYFLLTTLIGLVGSIIAIGILLMTIGKQIIITNDEYIAGDRYYELDICSQTIYKPTKTNPNNYVMPTKEEEDTCKEEKKIELIQSRKALFKKDLIGGGIWSLLFLIVLFVHYPKFMKTRKD